MSWYRTGTVAVTNGSKTITGVGTLFTTAVNVGDAFALVDANLNPTGAWYEVDVVVSNTEITLKQSYAGITGSNKQYCVFNMVGNMTTPSFAQRLATFFASFQSLIDKPTVTPTPASIPVADPGGKISLNWLLTNAADGLLKLDGNGKALVQHLPISTDITDGVVKLATTAEAMNGIDTSKAVTPLGMKASILSIVNSKFAAFAIKGEYTSATTYNPGDIVTYSSEIYLCIATALNKTPGASGNSSYWENFTIQMTTYNVAEGDPI